MTAPTLNGEFFRFLLPITAAAFVLPVAHAQVAVHWDGECLRHATHPSNRWNHECTLPGSGAERFTNWSIDTTPRDTWDITVGPGVPGGTRIFTSFSTRARSITSLSPLLVDGGGPVFFEEASLTDLTLDHGQLTVSGFLLLGGTNTVRRGKITTPFGQAEPAGTVVDGTLHIEGAPPNPFAQTALDTHLSNLGTLTVTGHLSTGFDIEIFNHAPGATTTVTGPAEIGGPATLFSNRAALTFDARAGAIFFGPELFSVLAPDHAPAAALRHPGGTLTLAHPDNYIATPDWTMGATAHLVLPAGFPGFGVPPAGLTWNGETLVGTTGARITVGENASLTVGNPGELRPLQHLANIHVDNHGTLTVAGVPESLIDPSRTVTFDPGSTLTNHQDAVLDLRGATRIESPAFENHGEVVLANDLWVGGFDGTLTVDATGRVTWLGGGLYAGDVTNHGFINLVDDPVADTRAHSLAADLDNHDTVGQRKKLFLGFSLIPATVTNHDGSLYYTEADIEPGGAGSRVVHTGGEFNAGGGGHVRVRVPFDLRGGSIDVAANTHLDLEGGGEHRGAAAATLQPFAHLEFDNHPQARDARHSFHGDLSVAAADPSAPATFTVLNADFEDGTLTADLPGPGSEIIIGFSDIGQDATVDVRDAHQCFALSLDVSGELLASPAADVLVCSQITFRAPTDPSLDPLRDLPYTLDITTGGLHVTGGTELVLSGTVRGADRSTGVLSTTNTVDVSDHATLDIPGFTPASLDTVLVLQNGGRFLPLERATDVTNINQVYLRTADLFIDGDFTNAGDLGVDANSSLNIAGTFTLPPGNRTEIDGILTSGGFVVQGSDFSGSGTVDTPHLTNDGTVNPGSSPGTLHLTGDYTQTAAATLVAEIGAAGHDTLAVDGTAALAGTLAVCLDPDTPLTPGATVTVLTASAITGTFDQIDLGAVPGRLVFEPAYTATAVTLTARSLDAPTFAAWQAAVFPPSHPARGASDDPDGDGLTNLLEYAFATRPSKPDPSPVTASLTAGTLQLTLPWHTPLTPSVQTSPDLHTWTPVPHTTLPSPPNTLRLSIPTTLPTTFTRLHLPTP